MKKFTIKLLGVVYDITVEKRAIKKELKKEGSQKRFSNWYEEIQRDNVVVANMSSRVFQIAVSAGQSVKKGDTVAIIEAMKMEIPVLAPKDGVIESIEVKVGDRVDQGQVLAVIY